MMAGIGAAVVGAQIGDISAAVEDVAVPRGFGIVRQYVGHGIGTVDARGPAGAQLPEPPPGITLRAGTASRSSRC
jgi:methionyl aminopeptidase